MPRTFDQRINELARGDGNRSPDEIKDERDIIIKAIKRATGMRRDLPTLDTSPLVIVRRALNLQNRGAVFRKQHKIANRSLRLNEQQLAFGVPPDPIREEFSLYCHLMYLGFQERFLNRHPGEEPEDFLDRARKMTMNLTRLVIDLKSQLYKRPPVREVVDKEATEQVVERLGEIWNDDYNLTLLHSDRMTHLLGVASIRPMYDPEAPGKIRLWTFLSHQLRVVPSETSPWKPAAVIERFDSLNQRNFNIWTSRSLVKIRKSQVTKDSGPHFMGRIPHTFFRDQQSFQSFFVEGAGRSLCLQNSTINDKLSDLNEIVQLQGFSIAQLFNPEEDDPRIGPRAAFVFRNEMGEPENIKKGIEFAKPDAPIKELMDNLDADVRNLLRAHRIPEAAIGVTDMGRRNVSGFAIRAAMAPLFENQEERGRMFKPAEADLTDSVLRVIASEEDDFEYAPEEPIKISIEYTPPRAPVSTDEEIKRDEFDVKIGLRTPPQIMRMRDPVRFPTEEDAEKQWLANLDTLLKFGPLLPVVFQEEFSDDEKIRQAIEDGPEGLVDFILNSRNGTDVIESVADAMAGE